MITPDSSQVEDLASVPSDETKRLNLFVRLIQKGFEVAQKENDAFHKNKEYVYGSALTDEDIRALEMDGRPTMNFPILKPYMLRSLKNIIDAMPTLDIVPAEEDAIDEKTGMPADTVAQILDTSLREILDCNNYEEAIYNVANDVWSGGKGVLEVGTRYKNNYNFDQEFTIKAAEDPTLYVFDSRSTSQTKEDGEFCAKLTPTSKEDFQAYNPNENWEQVKQQGQWVVTSGSYNQPYSLRNKEGKELAVICDMYYKKHISQKIYLLSDGSISQVKPNKDDLLVLGLTVTDMRAVHKVEIWHTRFCGHVELKKPQVTNFYGLPFIRVIGERIFKDGQEKLLPYAQHAIDAQRARNFMGNFFLNEALNHDQATYLVAKGTVDEQAKKAMRTPMEGNIIEYEAYSLSPVKPSEMVKNDPPIRVPAGNIPMEYLESFSVLDNSIEKSLGSQFPSMDETNMSGKALYNMADYMSASNEILIQNLMHAIRCAGQLIVDTMPKIMPPRKIGFVSPQDDPSNDNAPIQQQTIYRYEFEKDKYRVKISRGVNYKLQQQRNIEILLQFSQEYPPLAQFLFTDGFKFMVSNMDFNNREKLEQAYEKYQLKQQNNSMQQQAQQMQQMELAEKQASIENQRMNAEARMAKVQLDEQKLHAELQGKALDNQLEHRKISAEQKQSMLDNLVDMAHIKSTDINTRLRLLHEEGKRKDQKGHSGT